MSESRGSEFKSIQSFKNELRIRGLLRVTYEWGLQLYDASFANIDVSQNLTVLGDISCYGNVTGNIVGNVTGNIVGDVTGNIDGNVTGNIVGNVTGNILTASQTNITSVGILNSVDIDGGSIDNTIIGANTAAAGSFTTISTGSITSSGAISGGSLTSTGSITGANLTTTGNITINALTPNSSNGFLINRSTGQSIGRFTDENNSGVLVLQGYHPHGSANHVIVLDSRHGYIKINSVLCCSDDRIKSYEVPVTNAIETLKLCAPKYYKKHPGLIIDVSNETPDLTDVSWRYEYGLIAQDLERAGLSHFVKTNNEESDPNQIKSVFYMEFIPILLKAVQELDTIIQSQQNEINDLKANYNTRLSLLEAQLLKTSTL